MKNLKVKIFLVILAAFIVLAFIAILGDTEKGVVNGGKEIPFAGQYLSDLNITGKVNYRYYMSHRGDVSIVFSGISSEKDIRNFMDNLKNKKYHYCPVIS